MIEGPQGPTDWYYRNLVPKTPAENLRWRRWVLEKGYSDAGLAEELRIICGRDLLFFIGSFGWLLEPRDKAPWSPSRWFGECKEIPFIPRGYQEQRLLQIQSVLGKRDILIPKSRETGASWMLLYLTDHEWRFKSQIHIGLISRDEDTCSGTKNPDSLFSKLDFINDHLPKWLHVDRDLNQGERTIVNHSNGSTIAGEAATGMAFTGGRKKFVIQDEAHKFPIGADYAVQDSLQHVTYCRIMVSTVNRDRGQSGAFYDACMDEEADCERIEIDWKEDEDKRAGLYTSKEGVLELIDPSYKYPEKYRFVLDGKQRSPYYDWECRRPGATPASIAAELDRDFGGASAKFFDADVIQRAYTECREADIRGRFLRMDDGEFTAQFHTQLDGDCEFWGQLDINEATGLWCVPKTKKYEMGIDISAGTAGNASSYSAIVIIDKQAMEQVFVMRVNTMKPDQFARYCYRVGEFFNWARAKPETNGTVGQLFLAQWLLLDYPNNYMQETVNESVEVRWTGRVGIHNTDGGEKLLGNLQAMVRYGKVTIRSKLIVTECSRYYRDKTGKLVHPLVGKGRENAPERSHGDAAMACAGALHDIGEDQPEAQTAAVDEAPYGSWAWSRKQHQGSQHKTKAWWNPLPNGDGGLYDSSGEKAAFKEAKAFF